MQRAPRVLPYGGDLAVARSIARVHRPDRTGHCQAPSCRAPHPCRDWRQARLVILVRDPAAARQEVTAPVRGGVVRALFRLWRRRVSG